jgi:hypothetical protein
MLFVHQETQLTYSFNIKIKQQLCMNQEYECGEMKMCEIFARDH